MVNLVGRKVKQIRMHQGCHIEGIGQLEPTLPSNSKSGDIYMERTVGGVYVCFNYRPPGRAGSIVEFEIPEAQCIAITFYPEDKAKVESAA